MKIILLIAIGIATLASPGVLLGGTPSAEVMIGMFPKNVDEVAYVDLRQARAFSWFSQLEDKLLPERFLYFEKFLRAVGVNRDGRVDEVAWGLVGGDAAAKDKGVVGVALGNFDPNATQAYFRSLKLPAFTVHNLHFYGFGGGTGPTDLVFGFLDVNTAAFGQRRDVEKLIAVFYGEEQSLFSNKQMAPLITRADGSAAAWMVLDAPYARLALRQFLPQTAQLPQMAALLGALRALSVQVNAGDEVEADFEALCAAPNTPDTLTLAVLLRIGMMYQRSKIASSNPELAALFNSARVASSADRIDVHLALSEDKVGGLIHRLR